MTSCWSRSTYVVQHDDDGDGDDHASDGGNGHGGNKYMTGLSAWWAGQDLVGTAKGLFPPLAWVPTCTKTSLLRDFVAGITRTSCTGTHTFT